VGEGWVRNSYHGSPSGLPRQQWKWFRVSLRRMVEGLYPSDKINSLMTRCTFTLSAVCLSYTAWQAIPYSMLLLNAASPHPSPMLQSFVHALQAANKRAPWLAKLPLPLRLRNCSNLMSDKALSFTAAAASLLRPSPMREALAP
jgi:hypothetical protein